MSKLNSNAIVVKYLRDLFRDDELVNSIIFGTIDQRNLNKSSLFPLVHIMPQGMRIVQNRIEYTFDIAVVSLRNIEPDVTDNFYGDNLIDNLNQSSSILLRALNVLMFSHNEYDIDIDESWYAENIIFSDKNLLDGYQATITLSIQNEVSIC